MKVIFIEKFGPPETMEVREIEIPDISENEILVKNYASTVNTVDIVFRSGMKAMFGLARLSSGILRPKKKVLGFDIAGEIVKVGEDITEFKVGDRVFGGTSSGGYAEYCKTRPSIIAKMPSSCSFEEAASLPMVALTALQAIRDTGEIKSGMNVLIYGASGGIGTMLVQLAKYYDTNVTAIASGKNQEIVTTLGADHFIDYTKEEFTDRDEQYDIIVDAVGKLPPSKWKKSLVDTGIFVDIGSPEMSLTHMIIRSVGNKFRKKQFRTMLTSYNKKDLELIAKLVEEKQIRPVIEKTFAFDEIQEAHQQYETGRTVGKVVIRIQDQIE